MKKTLIIANMMFASATVFGMMPNNPNENSWAANGPNPILYDSIRENTPNSIDNLNPAKLSISGSELLNVALESLNFPISELKIEGRVPGEERDITSKLELLISKTSPTLQKS